MKKALMNRAKGNSPKKLKGFTLVELIVVMVILALLMALAIPQVTKYIDKAGEISMKSEARSCYTALQAYSVELYETKKLQGTALQYALYGDLTNVTTNPSTLPSSSSINVATAHGSASNIWKMANVPDNGRITGVVIDGTTVKEFIYSYYENGGQSATKITYKNGKYTKTT